MALQRELRVADAAAQQRCIGDERFDKPVVRAAQHLAGGGLFHAARGKLFCVEQRAFVIPLDEQRHFPQKYACHRVFDALLRIHFAERDVSVDELLHRLRIADIFERQPEAQHPLDDRIVTVAVHDPQPRPLSADHQIARDHVKAPPYAKQIIQRAHIFLVICR